MTGADGGARPGTVEVRLLRAADAEAVGPLHNRMWRLTYTGLVPQERLDALDDAASVGRWRELGRVLERDGRTSTGAVTRVLTVNGVPVGFAGAGPPRDDDAPASQELWSLYLAPEHHGSGLADVLMDASLPPGPAYLWVLRGNERAAAYYRKRGFVRDGATKPLAGTDALEDRLVRPD